MSFITDYLQETICIAEQINQCAIEKVVNILKNTRENRGRLFILGNGGSFATASHAVNDFRKIDNIESYCPENISELTARINDEGWSTTFVNWLIGCTLTSNDCVIILSVGGGDKEKNVSPNIIKAIEWANFVKSKVIAIVGKPTGFAQSHADICIEIPIIDMDRITPHAEEFQSIILHLIASHPLLKKNQTTWEKIELYEE